MKKIGFIDLDTKHPRSFVKRINAMDDMQVAAVYDRARVLGQTETDAFCREFGAVACNSTAALAQECDGVMVLSADWATHYPDLEVLLKAGVPCYCDKPLLASRNEVDAFIALANETDTPVFGGSGWRWNSKIQDAAAKYCNTAIRDVLISGPNQRFYYGIHVIETVLGLLGPGIDWCRVEKVGPPFTVVSLGHRRGTIVRCLLEAPFKYARTIYFSADNQDCEVEFSIDDIHNGVCDTFAEMVRSGLSPCSPEDLVESVMVMFALEESVKAGSRVDIATSTAITEIDSSAFMEEYCRNGGLAPKKPA